MASPATSEARTPIRNVLHMLPQGHEKALNQAFFNTAANIFAVVVCVAAVAVYYILEAFLRPLLWAVLCGTFLHPFKNTLTRIVEGWLDGMKDAHTPLVLGTILLPFKVADKLSEAVGSMISEYFKTIIAVCIGLPASYLLYYFGPVKQILAILYAFFCFVYDFLGYFSAIWVYTIVVAYILVVIFYWTPSSSGMLRPLAVPVWLMILFHASSAAGLCRVPLVVCVTICLAVGFAMEVKEVRSYKDASGGETPMLSPTEAGINAIKRIWSSSNKVNQSEPPSLESSVTESMTDSTARLQEESLAKEEEKIDYANVRKDETDLRKPVSLDTINLGSNVGSSTSTTGKLTPSTSRQDSKSQRSLSDNCFLALLWMIIFVQIWKSFWVVKVMLPVILVLIIFHRVGVHLHSANFVHNVLRRSKSVVQRDDRIEIILPKPVRGLVKLMIQGDRKIVSSLARSVNKIMSILIIILLVVGAILMSVFAAVQVQRESMHLVSVTSNILNNSLHPELGKWLPDSDEMQQTLDSMVGNFYLYGREWLANKVQVAFNGNKDSDAMQEQVLEMWDRIYQTWFARNISVQSLVEKKEDAALAINLNNLNMSISNIWDLYKRTDFTLNITGFINENIGVLMSVTDSVWRVLKGNINLIMNLLTATLSLLLGGGTAILNFVISVAVFLTTLFYLLASSGDMYKPVEWFSHLTPAGSGGGKFGTAIEDAVGSVFKASLKMAAFYGLYTWFTHTLFNINIVFIPSALAAIFAAIPFLGTYWAALPAVIELWLVQGNATLAVLLFVFHMVPSYVVDTAIYSEIKGGHPYLTGLAIAGGMYWMGLEGAIIGPILLCCLIVAVNVYTTLLKPEVATHHTSEAEDRIDSD